MSNNKAYLLLVAIIAIGFFLRSFRLVETLGYGHDADLYSWIVKDISLNHHLRLIGQETSTPGIFIGPLFYYFLIPFYILASYDPVGSIYAALTIGLITIFSYFFVYRKLFDQTTGLVAAFLQAVSTARIVNDRWIVPTVTVNLWCIWFILAIFKLAAGDFKYLILAGFLSGLIWHIHMALAPLLILIPLAIIFSKKVPTFKQASLFLLSFAVPMLPLFAFEIKHGFTQVQSFFLSFLDTPINIYGSSKIDDVFRESLGVNLILNLVLLGGLLFLPKFKVISWKLVTLLSIWMLSILAFFSLTKKLISEYYFENIKTVLLLIVILYVSLLIKSKMMALKLIGFGILIFVLYSSVIYFTSQGDAFGGLVDKKAVVKYIKDDSAVRQLPCLSVTYITSPGENFGYRYLFWINNLKMAKDGDGIPNYTIVFPYDAMESARFKSGPISVIPPDKEYNLEEVSQICPEKDYNQNHDFWGFTN